MMARRSISSLSSTLHGRASKRGALNNQNALVERQLLRDVGNTLGGIVNPLLGGGSSSSSSPAPSPSPSKGGGNGNGNGNGNGSGKGDGGSSGSSGGSPSPSSSGGSSGLSPASSGSGGDSSSGTSGSSSSSSSGSTTGGGTDSSSSSPTDSGSTNNSTSSSQTQTGTSVFATSSSSKTSDDTSVTTDAVPNPSTSPGIIITGISSGRTATGSNGSSTGSDTSIDGASNSGALNHRGISSGAIAGIVITFLVLLVVALVVVLRRRAILRRSERRQWWFTRTGARFTSPYSSPRSSVVDGASVGGSNAGGSAVGGGGGGGLGSKGVGSPSARSSFATTYDQSQSPVLDLDFSGLLPPIPPMAEVRGDGPLLVDIEAASRVASNTVPVGAAASIAGGSYRGVAPPASPSVMSNPYSPISAVSPAATFAPARGGNDGTDVSMSVYPFSPHEAYAFPKPPSSASSTDWSAMLKYAENGNGNGNVRPSTRSSVATGASDKSSPTAATFAEAGMNPFADPGATPTVASIGRVQVAGSGAPLAPAPASVFEEIEIIKRPFVPTLQDELVVNIGDQVKVLQVFDDGWAVVQKVHPPDPKGKGKAKELAEGEMMQGMIPIDCLRDPQQDIPAFLAQRRVSSYAEYGAVIAPDNAV